MLPAGFTLHHSLICHEGKCKRALLTIHPRNRHTTQGVLDAPSNSELENEFGTTNDDEIITKILEKGESQASEVFLVFPGHAVDEEQPRLMIDCVESRTSRSDESDQGADGCALSRVSKGICSRAGELEDRGHFQREWLRRYMPR